MIRHWWKLVWNRKRHNALLAVEIFVSFLVLFLVALSAVYFADNYRRSLGFDSRDMLSIQVEPNNQAGCATCSRSSDGASADPAAEAKAREEGKATAHGFINLLQALKEMPQVDSAATIDFIPYGNGNCTTGYQLKGRRFDSACNSGSDELARTFNIRLVAGRWFSEDDTGAKTEPLVINQRLAREVYGNENPVGKLLQDGSDQRTEYYRVVGVIEDFRQGGELAGPDNYTFSRWYEGRNSAIRHIVVHLRGAAPSDFEERVARLLQGIEPDWSFQIKRLAKMRHDSLRTRLLTLGAGALVAFFLTLMVGLGMVGVLWQNITRRSAEIGVRRALGATATTIYAQILGELFVITTFGLVPGAVLIAQAPMLQLTAWVSSYVIAVAAVVAALLIYLLALTAGLYPSWLAARVQPAVVLRSE